jgi:hypothetical protein
MTTFELTKTNDIGGIPKGFKLIVKSSKGYFSEPEKEEYLTALEYLPNVDKLKLQSGWNSLTGYNWKGHWIILGK